MKTETLTFRLEPRHRERLANLHQMTGLTPAAILRTLLDSAEVVPAKLSATIIGKKNTSAEVETASAGVSVN